MAIPVLPINGCSGLKSGSSQSHLSSLFLRTDSGVDPAASAWAKSRFEPERTILPAALDSPRPATRFKTKFRLDEPGRRAAIFPSALRGLLVVRWQHARLWLTGAGGPRDGASLFLLWSHVGAFVANHPQLGPWQCNRQGPLWTARHARQSEFRGEETTRVDGARPL
jgi:hypothetical protein